MADYEGEFTEKSEQPELPEVTDADINATQTAVADATLKSPMGWVVLDELYKQGLQRAYSTRHLTTPINNQAEVLKTKLSDPDAFFHSYRTLLSDLHSFTERLGEINRKHAGRAGQPDPADWPLLFSLSQDYNDALTQFDNTISPLLLALIEVLKEEHPEMVALVDTPQ